MSTNIVFTTSSGREFHSLIVRGKKEILQTYFFVLRITNLKGWFPRVWKLYHITLNIVDR